MINKETIFACASAQTRAGIAVFRVSGRQAYSCLEAFCGKKNFENRKVYFQTIKHPVSREEIDKGIILFFKSPRSFTGEDCVEFHVHGSPAILKEMSQAFYDFGLRQAFPGEFSKRAYINGKMDLIQVEGLADLIDAETELQRKQAYLQMEGKLSGVFKKWRLYLVNMMSWIEAMIDFPDEEDIPEDLSLKINQSIMELINEMTFFLENKHTGKAIREGIKIALIGSTNVGKSSLLNRILGAEKAIVTDIEGTTRDIIEVRTILSGMVTCFADTAGIRKTDHQIEAEGIKRAIDYAHKADIRLMVLEAEKMSVLSDLNDLIYQKEYLDSKEQISLLKEYDFVLVNKIDLLNEKKRVFAQKSCRAKTDFEQKIYAYIRNIENCFLYKLGEKPLFVFELSALTGEGINNIKQVISEVIRLRFSLGENPYITRVRHQESIRKALISIKKAKNNLTHSIELCSEDLRSAKQSLEELIGLIGVNDILDKIFLEFCIGK